MKLNDVILQIRSRCTDFGNRVAGAVEFQGLTENSSVKTPCAYVIPYDETADAERGSTGYKQVVTAAFGVVVVCSAKSDERGQAGYISVETLQDDLFKALLLWKPNANQSEITYRGCRYLGGDRSRVFYEFEFAYDYQINMADTWQSVSNPTDNFGKVDMTVRSIDGDPEGTQVAHAQFTIPTQSGGA